MSNEQKKPWARKSLARPATRQTSAAALKSLKLQNARLQQRLAERESEQKYRGFVEDSSEGFTLIDEQGAIIEWNHARETMTGLPASQVLGKPFWDVQYEMLLPELPRPEHYARIKQLMLAALRTGRSPLFNDAIEAEIMRPDGTRRFIQQTIFPIKTNQGYQIGLVTSDITERKRAEQNIALMSIALNNVHEAAFLIDGQARFQFVNEEACRVLGYTRAELLCLGVPDIDPDFPLERWPGHWESLKAQHSLTFESRHRAKDGGIFPVEINASYFEYDGQGCNLALVRDITERQRAEKALWQTNELLERVFANVDLLIAAMDTNFDFIRVNRAYAEADQRAPEFFVGKNHFAL